MDSAGSLQADLPETSHGSPVASPVSFPDPGTQVVRRIWRAPRGHGSLVMDPPWQEAVRMLQRKRAPDPSAPNLAGLDWSDWRQSCRDACLQAARDYTVRQLGAQIPESIDDAIQSGAVRMGEIPLVVDGHQPELFHPGVWAKNFAISRLATAAGGVALHLIVDNDASSQSSILAPAGSRELPARVEIPFDDSQSLQPWEIRTVQNSRVFDSFADRVTASMSAWQIKPLIESAWPAAVEQRRQGAGLADCLTAARVSIERRWGIHNLELPMSRLCELPPFLALVAEIVRRLPDFAGHYNAVLAEYRELNGVRSRSHPVPELARDGDWWEAPFWVWREGALRRDRLWANCSEGGIRLRDSQGEFLTAARCTAHCKSWLVDALSGLGRRGIRLRSRALTTTMFARLGLADLFIHGLGGAKYDEMTDALIARFFGIRAPQFMTVSATFHLPLGGAWPASVQQLGSLRHEYRDLEQNPQRHLPAQVSESAQRLIEERTRLVQELHPESGETPAAASRGQRRKHYQRLRAINAELLENLDCVRVQSEMAVQQARRQLAANQVLGSREFSWTLFPEELLHAEYAAMFPGMSHWTQNGISQ